MSSNMRGLINFIGEIRGCPNKEAEEKRVEKELHKIREKFTNKKLSGYDRRKYIWKMIYISMLGYSIDFGQMECVNLISSQKFAEKKTGYLACSLLLQDNIEILGLIINTLKKDLQLYNTHPYTTCIALNAISNIGVEEFSENLFSDLLKLAFENPSCPNFIRKKVLLCLLSLSKFHPPDWILPYHESLIGLLNFEKDVNVLTALSSLLLNVLEISFDRKNNNPSYTHQVLAQPILFAIIKLLQVIHVPGGSSGSILSTITSSVNANFQGTTSASHFHHNCRIHAPWTVIKLLRCLQYLPLPFDNTSFASKFKQMAVIIFEKTAKAQSQGLSRVMLENGVLYELILLILPYGGSVMEENIMIRTMEVIKNLMDQEDLNLRYVGLECTSKIGIENNRFLPSLKERLDNIIKNLKNPDTMIQKQTINVLHVLSDSSNWKVIVTQLLEHIDTNSTNSSFSSTSAPSLSPASSLTSLPSLSKYSPTAEIRSKIGQLIVSLTENINTDILLYIDILFKLLLMAPDSLSDEHYDRFLYLLSLCDHFQEDKILAYTLKKSVQAIESSYPHYTNDLVIRFTAYTIGEYAPMVLGNNYTYQKLIQLLLDLLSSPLLSYLSIGVIILAVSKLFKHFHNHSLSGSKNSLLQLQHQIIQTIHNYTTHHDLELQQRALELQQILQLDATQMDNILAPTPLIQNQQIKHNAIVKKLLQKHQ